MPGLLGKDGWGSLEFVRSARGGVGVGARHQGGEEERKVQRRVGAEADKEASGSILSSY